MSYRTQQPASRRETTRRPRPLEEDESAEGGPFAVHDMQQHRAGGEPCRRRRIPRACESCRKRKIRCDGNEVCDGCRSSSIMCVYRDADGTGLVKEHLQQFDSRLNKMEGMLADFLMKFEVAQGKTSAPENRSGADVETGSGSQREEGRDTRVEVEAETDEGVGCPPSPPLSHVQGGTNSRNGRPAPPDRDLHRTKRRKLDRRSTKPTYADAYGELHADEWGQLRYIGLSSAMSVIDICMPFREHINRGLENKGYEDRNNFLGPAPSICEALTPQSTEAGSENTGPFTYGHLPPALLVEVLLPSFYERMYFILPVITKADFETQLAELTGASDQAIRESDFLPVLYGLLAVAALNVPQNCQRLDDEILAPYRNTDLGASYFALSTTCKPFNGHHYGGQSSVGRSTGRPTPPYPRRSLNPVIALVLQAAYLAAIGSQAEAWILIGQAVRLGQDLGLHRSAAQLGLPSADQERRRYTWWCIYSLDRTLSAALGRPLAIRDADCDVELPQSDESPDGHDCTGFIAILNLRCILGEILTTVASVRTVKAGRHVSKTREMQAMVVGLNAELQAWATKEVPESIKAANEGQLGVEKFIALSGHFCALLLLYRFFVGNPHRPSPLKDNEALFQCARAATNCIRITDKIVKLMPICADLVFHTQHVFTSSVILLQCIRRSDDAGFIQEALNDVEQATRALRQLQNQWPGASRLAATVEEYVEFTISFIERGMAGRCAFHHDKSEFTGLELRDESGRFPANWAQLAFKRLPIGPLRNPRLHALAHSNGREQTSFLDRSPYSRPHPPTIDLTDNASANQPAVLSSMDNPPMSSSPSNPNFFRFALPQKRPTATAAAATTVATPGTSASNRSAAAKLASVFPPLPNEAHQSCHALCRDDDPTRSWSIGVADGSFDHLLMTGTDTTSDMFGDNTAYFTGDGLWSSQ